MSVWHNDTSTTCINTFGCAVCCCFVIGERDISGGLDLPQLIEICKLPCSPQLADGTEHGQNKLDSSYWEH
ncbi:hypothetical protein BRADI_1g46223v3 [Brachypodium distachyon]|uniref:Uncharacterized protein n=1 Tax=Brachypodium distachyon TaxID=15368 RepID=A0A2K2DPN3_BRADI|nr:hypothetical protein BRADI_1g46223v3 [Brachypodium distachyon]